MTPRQTCPRPNGVGRNLRSKTRWFTGFCNSHQVSHFATFFIDARAEISVAESRLDIHTEDDEPPARSPSPGRRGNALSFKFLGAIHAGVRYARKGRPSGSAGARRARRPPPGRWGRGAARPPAPERRNVFSGRSAMQVSTMILPQVHLRKPCYDFSFL